MAVLVSRTDRIGMKAAKLGSEEQLKRVLIATVTLLPFLLGWVVRKTVMIVWGLIAWLWAAVVVGWQAAGGSPNDE